MYAITKNCGKCGHAEFSVRSDDTLFPENLDHFLEWFEKEVSVGKRFLPGQTVQMGWSLLKIFERRDGTLGLSEPDFKSMPIVFVDSISNTLLHTILQKSVTESLGLENELNLPPLQYSAIICTEFGINTDIFLSRADSSGSDSGWFLGCTNANHDHQTPENLRRVSLYEVVVRLDEQIIPYLGLPVGVEICIRDSVPTFKLLGKAVEIKVDSYLDKKIQKNEIMRKFAEE